MYKPFLNSQQPNKVTDILQCQVSERNEIFKKTISDYLPISILSKSANNRSYFVTKTNTLLLLWEKIDFWKLFKTSNEPVKLKNINIHITS